MNRLAQFLTGLKPFGPMAGGLMWIVWIISNVLGTGNLDRNGQVIGTDHTAFHTAAVFISEGQGHDLYDFPDLSVFADRQQSIVDKAGFIDPFRNPPIYALLYVPTAELPYLVSYAIWAAIGLLTLAGGLYLICGSGFKRALGWSLTFYPVFATVTFGQNTLLSFGIFAIVYRLLATERLFLAGLVAGLLLFKPHLLLGLGLWWLLGFRRYWRCLAGLAVATVIFATLSLVLLPETTATWIRKLPEIARYDAFEFYNLHNPRGFGALLTGSRSVGNAFGMAGLCLTIVGLALFWRRHAGDRDMMFAAAVFATLWGSPHTMVYEWALVVIPAILLWRSQPGLRSIWLPLFALAWIVMFISTPLTKLQVDATGYAVQISVPVMAAVAVIVERTSSRCLNGGPETIQGG